MSLESRIEVVEIGKVGQHPNADRLDITHVHGGYPCIVQRDSFKTGDRAVYIPVDSVVPLDDSRFAFLKSARIRAMRLRGIFSMGLLIPAEPDMALGEDVATRLGISKYEPPAEITMGGEGAPDPGIAPVYDVEGLRMFPEAFIGSNVHVTEKIHGTNFRAVYTDGQLHVGSHRRWLKDGANLWWDQARKYELAGKLAAFEGLVFYGEVFGGKVQDLKYGLTEPDLIFYDILSSRTREFVSPDVAAIVLTDMGLPYVPVLYIGPWHDGIPAMAEGKSILAGNIREGIVIRPIPERFSPEIGGRLILKLAGEGYLTRKEIPQGEAIAA